MTSRAAPRKSAARKPAAKHPAAKKPAVKQPAAKKPAASQPPAIEPSAFLGSDAPRAADLARALGPAAGRWEALKAGLADDLGPLGEEWTYAGKKRGWSLRLKRGERAIVYLTPLPGRFRAAFALGEKAVADAHASRLPARVLAAIDQAPRYAEGRGVWFEVLGPEDAAGVRALAAIKARN